jgi:hypothetical protein
MIPATPHRPEQSVVVTGFDVLFQETSQPFPQGRQLGFLRRIARRKFLQQPHRAQRKAVAKMLFVAVTQNELRAAAARVENQQRKFRQRGIRRHPVKRPVRLLFTRDDFHLQTRGAFYGVEQSPGIPGVARGAGGDDPDGFRLPFTRRARETGDDGGGLRHRFGLQPVRLIKSLSEPRLFALLAQRPHVPTLNLGDEQLDRVRANINDSAPLLAWHGEIEATGGVFPKLNPGDETA